MNQLLAVVTAIAVLISLWRGWRLQRALEGYIESQLHQTEKPPPRDDDLAGDEHDFEDWDWDEDDELVEEERREAP